MPYPMNCDGVAGPNNYPKRQQIIEEATNQCISDCRDSDSMLVTICEAYIRVLGIEEAYSYICSGLGEEEAKKALGFNPATGEEVPDNG